MRYSNVAVGPGGYWSSPFLRWQGSFGHLHPVPLAASVVKEALRQRELDASQFTALYLGMTVPAKHLLYLPAWLGRLIGADHLTGPLVNAACATGARVLATASADLETGAHGPVLAITCDRLSNAPQIYYPNPLGPGGKGESDNWPWDGFSFDPSAGTGMVDGAEQVARWHEVSRDEQEEVAVLRSEQYGLGSKEADRFRGGYIQSPIDVLDRQGRKVIATVAEDGGIRPKSRADLSSLRPALDDGTITTGTQTYPADGNAGILLASRQEARALGGRSTAEIQVTGFHQVRAGKGRMAEAASAAAVGLLAELGQPITDFAVVKTHNPFAANDVIFSRTLGIKCDAFNHYGSSLVYGHPQGPTAMRLIIEVVHELMELGGGYGLFAGCSAGDTGVALTVHVGGPDSACRRLTVAMSCSRWLPALVREHAMGHMPQVMRGQELGMRGLAVSDA
jgi:acetyl-CoA acetyltransferase